MQYIDKNNASRLAGNQVTLDYLNTHCKDANGHYDGILYRDRTRTRPDFMTSGTSPFYDRMVRILMNEQGCRCCYCLRRLQPGMPNCDETVTIEHIVPQGFDGSNSAEFSEYADFSPSIKLNVVLTSVFQSQSGVQAMPPYPHKVAYDNMVVSCNGSFPSGINSGACCNIKRGQAKALPVYFLNDIADQIDYTKNGAVDVKGDAAQYDAIVEVIDNVHLSCDSLKDIRRVWYELRVCDILEIRACDTEEKREKLLTETLASDLMVKNQNEANRLITKFKNQDYWHTLMLYDIFHTIMKTRYSG